MLDVYSFLDLDVNDKIENARIGIHGLNATELEVVGAICINLGLKHQYSTNFIGDGSTRSQILIDFTHDEYVHETYRQWKKDVITLIPTLNRLLMNFPSPEEGVSPQQQDGFISLSRSQQMDVIVEHLSNIKTKLLNDAIKELWLEDTTSHDLGALAGVKELLLKLPVPVIFQLMHRSSYARDYDYAREQSYVPFVETPEFQNSPFKQFLGNYNHSLAEVKRDMQHFKPILPSPMSFESYSIHSEAEDSKSIDSTTTQQVGITSLLKHHSLFRAIENKFLQDYRHVDEGVQHEYDKRFGLMLKP